jgi:hypothetical protein
MIEIIICWKNDAMFKDLDFQCEDEKFKSSHLKSFLKTFLLIS